MAARQAVGIVHRRELAAADHRDAALAELAAGYADEHLTADRAAAAGLRRRGDRAARQTASGSPGRWRRWRGDERGPVRDHRQGPQGAWAASSPRAGCRATSRSATASPRAPAPPRASAGRTASPTACARRNTGLRLPEPRGGRGDQRGRPRPARPGAPARARPRHGDLRRQRRAALHAPRPVAGYARRLGEIFERLHHAGPRRRSWSPRPLPSAGTSCRSARATRARVEAGMRERQRRDRARSPGEHCVPCLDVADHPGLRDRDNFATDGLHPSIRGHARAGARVRLSASRRLPGFQSHTWRETSHEHHGAPRRTGRRARAGSRVHDAGPDDHRGRPDLVLRPHRATGTRSIPTPSGRPTAVSPAASRTECWCSPTRSASCRSTPSGCVALRGLGSATFKRPVGIGDTIRVRCRVESTRPLDDETALVTLAFRILNQDDRDRRPGPRGGRLPAGRAAADGRRRRVLVGGVARALRRGDVPVILEGRRILITGVVNRHSIAYGDRRARAAARRRGAADQLRPDPAPDRARRGAARPGAGRCSSSTSTTTTTWRRSPDEVGARWDGLDGAVHAIAHAPPDALGGNFLGAPRDSAKAAFETSAYSLKALAEALAPLMGRASGRLKRCERARAGREPGGARLRRLRRLAGVRLDGRLEGRPRVGRALPRPRPGRAAACAST